MEPRLYMLKIFVRWLSLTGLKFKYGQGLKF